VKIPPVIASTVSIFPNIVAQAVRTAMPAGLEWFGKSEVATGLEPMTLHSRSMDMVTHIIAIATVK